MGSKFIFSNECCNLDLDGEQYLDEESSLERPTEKSAASSPSAASQNENLKTGSKGRRLILSKLHVSCSNLFGYFLKNNENSNH